MSLLLNKLHHVYMDETTGDDAGGAAAPAQTAPSAEEVAAAPVDDGSAELDFDGISDILNAPDPFEENAGAEAPAKNEGADGAQPDGAEGEAAAAPAEGEPGKTETPASEEEPGGKEAATEESPELALMRQTMESQKTLIEQLQKGTPGDKAPDDKGGEEEHSVVPDYAFTIPDGLMNLMDSEDTAERRQGIGALAQGVAQTVHKQMLGQVQEMMSSVVPQTVMNVVQQQTQAKAIFEDFYGTHQDLNKEELKPIIVQVAEKVMKEAGTQEWSPKVRDVIAARVKSLLQQGTAPVAPAAPTTPPASPGGVRQSRANNSAPGADALADDVGALLF